MTDRHATLLEVKALLEEHGLRSAYGGDVIFRKLREMIDECEPQPRAIPPQSPKAMGMQTYMVNGYPVTRGEFVAAGGLEANPPPIVNTERPPPDEPCTKPDCEICAVLKGPP